MSVFTASDGTEVLINTNGTLAISGLWALPSEKVQPMREFFRHEEDERLGRWRWPEKPDYVVYPDSLNTTPPVGAIRVWNEKTGVSRRYLNRDGVDGIGGHFDTAASAYFDAHPEPKPWHAAKHAEVWEFDTGFGLRTATRHGDDGHFFWGHNGQRADLESPTITSARRIWPGATS